MNVHSYVYFVAPIILARRLNISIEEADKLIQDNLTDYGKNLLKEEKEMILND